MEGFGDKARLRGTGFIFMTPRRVTSWCATWALTLPTSIGNRPGRSAGRKRAPALCCTDAGQSPLLFHLGRCQRGRTSAPSRLLHRPPTATGPLLETLEAHFKSLSDESMLKDLIPLGEKSNGALAVSDLPEPAKAVYKPENDGGAILECRQFKGLIRRDWVISSFTYFKAGLHEELPDRDAVAAPARKMLPEKGCSLFQEERRPAPASTKSWRNLLSMPPAKTCSSSSINGCRPMVWPGRATAKRFSRCWRRSSNFRSTPEQNGFHPVEAQRLRPA